LIIRIPPFFSPRRLIQIPYHPPPGLHVRRCVMTSSNRSAPLCAQPPPHCNTRIVMAPRPGPGCAASQTLFHPHRERLCELIRRSILFHPKRSHGECAACGSRRVGAPQHLQKPTGCAARVQRTQPWRACPTVGFNRTRSDSGARRVHAGVGPLIVARRGLQCPHAGRLRHLLRSPHHRPRAAGWR
jgi:hypothetical protein